MNIKNDMLYTHYICYLENKKMSNGERKLSKISESLFNEFKHRYENEPYFSDKINKMYITEKRDEQINNVIDFEIILDDNNLKHLKTMT